MPSLSSDIIVPQAVVDEIAAGRAAGVSLPDPAALDWVAVRHPASEVVLPLVTDLGRGETEVLMLCLEEGGIAVLDDGLARRIAEHLGVRLTGTLGLLLDAKQAGLIGSVAPLLDRLQELRFRVAPHTRNAILSLANE